MPLLLATIEERNWFTLRGFGTDLRWKHEVLSQRKPSTQRAAGVHLGRYILHELGSLRLDQLTLETQQAFVALLSKRLSHKSILNAASTLSAVLNTARAWGYITEG